MRVAIIGRSEILYDTMLLFAEQGHEIGVIITAKEAPEYTKTAEDFRLYAEQYNIPFFKTATLTDLLPELQKLETVDIGISMNYSGIIAQSVIECFPLGILNAHGGDLPRYRGNACQAWAILNGEDRIGLCIHGMIGGELDSGNIIARDYTPVTIDTKVGEVWNWMAERIPELFSDAAKQLDGNPGYVLDIQSKNPMDALRCYPRTPDDGRIEWGKDNISVLRLINASNKPYAGAFAEWNGQKMIIWDAKLAPEENFVAVPGQVASIGDEYIDVTCGTGKIRIFSVEVDGKECPPDQLIKSIRTRLS